MQAARVAIVGTGGIARSHMAALRAAGERVEVVAAADVDGPRVEAFAADNGIPHHYTDVGELLAAERPGLVHVATPPATHTGLAVQCLEAGAWVLCEKPLCGSLADLDRIQEAERRTGRHCASVFQWRFGSAGQHLHRLIDEEAMGRALVGVCSTTWYRDVAYYEVPWRGRWDTELGGPTMGHGNHAMDLFLWLLGEWREVSAMIGTLDRAIAVEDVSMAMVRFESGAMGSIVNSVLSPRQETYLRLDFQRSTVEVRALYGYGNDSWTFSGAPGVEEATVEGWRAIPEDVPSGHPAQLRALLDRMERDQAPPADTAGVRTTIEFLSSLYKSAVTGAVVERGSIRPGDPFYEHVGGTLAR
ncbi:MAG TPA: Gfo/Idh/MocA family oxidoreductase [Candidatus Dormibacteraeota bacterium]|jgi:predicted dehydrogenase|nr:Gfo/Idh/MocA family oxidoreductase [Candidatus Dormibacteraeota bacterium]